MLLVELQKLDSMIISKDRAVREIPLKLSSIEGPLREAGAAIEKQRRKLSAADKKKREEERVLNESNDRIEKLKERTAEIRDNKAYQAHLREIEAAENHSDQIEDEILALMEVLEEEGKRLGEAEEALKLEEEAAAQLKEALEEETREGEEELRGMKARRKEFTEKVTEENYNTYIYLLQGREGLAVVEAKEELCTGCNMHIMPQLFVEVKKNEGIIQCPQCRRIIYYKEPSGQ
jgi:predicted  nucleic acid-binding Zn-ribbon protein